MYCDKEKGIHRFGWEKWEKLKNGRRLVWCLECGEKIGELRFEN